MPTHPAPHSRCLAPCFFPPLRNQLVGETAALELADVGAEPPFHHVALLDDQSFVINANHEVVAGLEAKRLANRCRYDEATLRAEAYIGLGVCGCRVRFIMPRFGDCASTEPLQLEPPRPMQFNAAVNPRQRCAPGLLDFGL